MTNHCFAEHYGALLGTNYVCSSNYTGFKA